MVDREEGLKMIKEYVKNDKLLKHMLAVSVIMKALAQKMGEDENLWELTGLLHDIDYEIVGGNFERHGIESTENILKGLLPEIALNAIKAHNELTGFKCEEKIAYALRAADQVSGLIIATALVMPNKKLEEVKVSSLKKKFKQKDFARNVKREDIMLCEKLGINLDEFLEISLNALKGISNELGL